MSDVDVAYNSFKLKEKFKYILLASNLGFLTKTNKYLRKYTPFIVVFILKEM